MALNTYDDLRTSILLWLARPGDPLVSPAVPDMVRLFEAEASRRLKVGAAERRVNLTTNGSAAVGLPGDFGELRLASSGGRPLRYVAPADLNAGGYTIIGNDLVLSPVPPTGTIIDIVYQFGVPPLSSANPSNWLLAAGADCYLFGSLVEAEAFIGSDERIPLWLQRREAAFAGIEAADRKARWPGGLQVQVDGLSGGSSSGTVSSGGALATGGGDVRVVNALSGDVVVMSSGERALFVASGALAALTIRLPLVFDSAEVELCFANSVTALTVQTATGTAIAGAPVNAYGPGAAIFMRYVSPNWLYWK